MSQQKRRRTRRRSSQCSTQSSNSDHTRTLRVEPVTELSKSDWKSVPVPQRTLNCELYFRAMNYQLPDNINKGHIRRHFAEFEKDIVRVIIARNEKTKQSKGFGFIKFTSHQVAVDAKKKLHGSMLQDEYQLYVDMRRPSAFTSESGSVRDMHKPSACTSESAWVCDTVRKPSASTSKSDSVRDMRKPSASTSELECVHDMRKPSACTSELELDRVYDMRKPSATTCESASTHSARNSEIRWSGKFPEFAKIDPEELRASFSAIGSRNNTRLEQTDKQTVIIRGDRIGDIDKSRKELTEFVEKNLATVTLSIQLSCAFVNFFLVKRASYLKELRRQCEIHIPPVTVSEESISITIKGKQENAEEVAEKLKKLSSKCHVELFEAQYPKSHARLWKMNLDDLSRQNPKVLIDIDFTTSQATANKGNKYPVTVLIVGTDKVAVQDLKDKVLKDESFSNTTVQRLRLSDEEFEAVSCTANLKKLELKLETCHSTVINLQSSGSEKVVELVVPSSLEANMESARQEVMKCISTFSQNQQRAAHTTSTTATQFRFDDIVLGMQITSKPKYCEAILKEAAELSVGVHIQRKPKPCFQLHGSSESVEAIQQKIHSLSIVAERQIDQAQVTVARAKYHLLSSDAFSKYQEELLEKTLVSVSYPPQQGLLRQRLLCTSIGHMITLQLCVGDVTTENVDAIIIDLDQAERLPDPIFQVKFKEYVQKNGTPNFGSATCHDGGSLPSHSVIVVPIPNWTGETCESSELLFSPFEEPLACSHSKGFGAVSFVLSVSSEKMSDELSTTLLLYMIERFCESHPKMSIHTIRIVVNRSRSAQCTTVFDKQIAEMKVVKRGPTIPKQSSRTSMESLLPSPASSLQWQWFDDRRQFTSYPPHISAKLTKAMNFNPNGKCTFTIGGKSYAVSFSTMTQTNVETGFTRDVQHIHCVTSDKSTKPSTVTESSQSSTSVQWYYMDDQNILTPYTRANSNAIERMYNRSTQATYIVINGRQYSFDFNHMKQINASTKHERNIQRKTSAPSKKRNEESLSPNRENQPDLVITFRGPKENVYTAKNMVSAKLQDLCFAKTVPLPQAASNRLQQKLHTIIRTKHSTVEYRIKVSDVEGGATSKSCKVLEIEGPEHAVHKAVTEVQSEIINYHSETPSSAASVAIEYPKEWQPQTKTTEVFELPRYSDERRQILSKLKTLPNSTITSIKRIQNKWLWEKYDQCRRRMHDKNSGRVNEKQLFHGSRNTQAEKIYDSEEGFDMRFSSQGFWGQANYFAVDASYSDSFTYLRTDGNKELFLARVLTGDSYKSPQDRTLRMPPEKQHTDNKLQLKQIRYDTVNGVTSDTRVFMTYSNDLAYPAYLIVYSTTSSTYASPLPRSIPATPLSPQSPSSTYGLLPQPRNPIQTGPSSSYNYSSTTHPPPAQPIPRQPNASLRSAPDTKPSKPCCIS